VNNDINQPAFSDGDDLVLLDRESGLILYGHEIAREALRSKKTLRVLIVHLPAEAYIALLQTYFFEVPEVRTYLTAWERSQKINPDGNNHLLEAVSDAIWLQKRHLDILQHAIEHTD
jgi:hypothetical protein